MFFINWDTLDKTRVFWGLKRCRFIFFIVKRARLSSAAGCDYCCFWTRKKKVNFMCILRINNCGKKQMWNKSCIVIEIPKIWKISPNGNLTVTSKNGWKGASGQDQSNSELSFFYFGGNSLFLRHLKKTYHPFFEPEMGVLTLFSKKRPKKAKKISNRGKKKFFPSPKGPKRSF